MAKRNTIYQITNITVDDTRDENFLTNYFIKTDPSTLAEFPTPINNVPFNNVYIEEPHGYSCQTAGLEYMG